MPKPQNPQEVENAARDALIQTLKSVRMTIGPFEAWLAARRATLADGLLRDGADIERTRGKAEFMTELQTLLAQAAPEPVQGDENE